MLSLVSFLKINCIDMKISILYHKYFKGANPKPQFRTIALFYYIQVSEIIFFASTNTFLLGL